MRKSLARRRQVARRGASGAQKLQALQVDVEDRSIKIDLAALQPPQNVYDADLAQVEHSPGDVRLFFGKLKRPGRTRLRTRVEIRYPVETFYRHLWRNSRDFHDRLRNYLATWNIPNRDEIPVLSDLESDKDHSDWANFDYMGHTGTEAVIDFFQLPTKEIADFVQTGSIGRLEVESKLRVQLTANKLLDFLDDCAKIVPDIESYLPNNFRDR